MSYERYIIRSEDSMNKILDWGKIKNTPACYNYAIPLIKELYKYKDEIDYNSWLYVVTTTYENTPKNDPVTLCHSYEITNPTARRYKETITGGTITYTTDESTILVPRAVLLFNGKNECKHIEFSLKLLSQIMDFKKGNFFNLGSVVYLIDSTYDSTSNSILHYEVQPTSSWNGKSWIEMNTIPVDLVRFISKNIPSVNNYNTYPMYLPPKYIRDYINEHLNDIIEDLKLDDIPIIKYPSIHYIPKQQIDNDVRKAKINILINELRSLGIVLQQ